ncbi:MAG: C40 family peptidase [Clostridiaceae bacterium]|nr:C40 family peptidase [Clostridiaceae bacterium]
MKILRHAVLIIAVMAVLFMLTVISASAEEIGYGVVTASCLNVRAKPDINAEIWDQVKYGQTLKIYEVQGKWLLVGYGESYSGWVHGDYVSVRKENVSRSGGQVDREAEEPIGTKIANFSKKFLGVPYRYGGTTTKGFDCSGFAQYVYKQFGITINRVANDQKKNGTYVERKNLMPGDLVCFGNPSSGYVDHVGIYVGDNQFIHASSTGSCVKLSSLSEEYYSRKYVTARRIVN